MKREMICISCPLGCTITVTGEPGGKLTVTGNTCKRGEVYAVGEVTAPKRMVTSSVRVESGELPMVSVKTSFPIPKERIFEALALLKDVAVKAPVREGDAVLRDILGLGADFVSTKDVGEIN